MPGIHPGNHRYGKGIMTSITIEFDPDALTTYTDQHLAMLWHLVQANPANGFDHSQPGDLAVKVGGRSSAAG